MGRFKENQAVKSYLTERFNTLGLEHHWNHKNIVFSHSASREIAKRIAPYVPPCMHYKIPEALRGEGLQTLENEGTVYLPTYVPILTIEPASKRKYRNRGLYDLHIEGHHNYLAGNMDNGFVVHNSMPGGRALKFLSCLTVRVAGRDDMDKTVHPALPAFKHVTAQIAKAKCPIVHKNFEYNLVLIPHKGYSMGDVADWKTVGNRLKDMGVITKAGKSGYFCVNPDGEHAEYPTLDAIRERYVAEQGFKRFLHQLILDVELAGDDE